MKRQILKAVKQIKKAGEAIYITRKVELHYAGVAVSVWDALDHRAVISLITKYPRYQHYLTLGERLPVALLLE